MAKPKKKKGNQDNVLANNRKARHDYNVLETYEAGIKLSGTEVKSCRASQISLVDSYAQIDDGQMKLYHAHISQYDHGNIFNHDPRQVRILLMHKKEILKISQKTREAGYTLIPLKFYLKKGLVKVLIGLCTGKNTYDKRNTMRERQDNMEAKRAMKNFNAR
jgi:SsrA-binding protein